MNYNSKTKAITLLVAEKRTLTNAIALLQDVGRITLNVDATEAAVFIDNILTDLLVEPRVK